MAEAAEAVAEAAVVAQAVAAQAEAAQAEAEEAREQLQQAGQELVPVQERRDMAAVQQPDMAAVQVRDTAARLVWATAARLRGTRCKRRFPIHTRVAKITAHQASLRIDSPIAT